MRSRAAKIAKVLTFVPLVCFTALGYDYAAATAIAVLWILHEVNTNLICTREGKMKWDE